MTEDSRGLTTGLAEENKNLKIELGLLKDAYWQLKTITARFEASECQVKEDKEFLDDIVNAIGDPVMVKDGESRFIIANDALCKMLGVARKDILGKTLGESLPKDQMDHFLEIDRGVLNTGQENLCEEVLTGQGGKLLTIVTRKTRYVDGKGRKFLVGVIRDITDRKISEENTKSKVVELEHVLKLMTGRELKMVELKGEIKVLKDIADKQ
jgi:PAS domain S-box-containing protein